MSLLGIDVVQKRWSREILTAAGVEESLLSPAHPSGTVIGTLKRELAAELGLPGGVAAVTGGHDTSPRAPWARVSRRAARP